MKREASTVEKTAAQGEDDHSNEPLWTREISTQTIGVKLTDSELSAKAGKLLKVCRTFTDAVDKSFVVRWC